MQRNLNKLANEDFDLLVVGGGIYGATLAWEAALRGLKVAIIEARDFGHATSANSLKVIHGGLRYLQHADFKRMRRSIWARSELMRIAPHIVNPLMFIMPTYGHLLNGRAAMAVALRINDLMAWDRNRHLGTDKIIPKGKTISASRTLALLPQIDKKGLGGGAIWYDGIAENTERLTLEFIIAAAHHGACVANYMEAKRLILNGDTVIGLQAHDGLDGRNLEIRSRVMVNATGPWVNKLLEMLPGKPRVNVGWAKAVNVVLNRPQFKKYAVGLAGKESFQDKDAVVKRGRRLFFFVPWQGHSMLGTSYKKYFGEPEELRIREEDIVEILEEINFGYPAAQLTLDDVSFWHTGLVPIYHDSGRAAGPVRLIKRSMILDHQVESRIEGIVTVSGVKYTTAIATAEDTVDLVCDKLRRGNLKKGFNPLLPGALGPRLENHKASQNRLNRGDKAGFGEGPNYSPGAGCLNTSDAAGEKKGPQGIGRGEYLTAKEQIEHAVREEMASRLADVVFRRTAIGTKGDPGGDIIVKCAEVMSRELNWDAARRRREVDGVRSAFRVNR